MSDTPDAGRGSATDVPVGSAQTPTLRRSPKRMGRRIVIGIVIVVVVGTAVWWRRAVTSDPKLQFTLFNRVNRVENDVTGDPEEGITQTRNVNGTQVDLAFVSGQRFFVYLGLRNDGSQTLRITEAPPAGFYYFGFDTMEVSSDPSVPPGAMTTYEPFKPFTLEPGQVRSVRLHFRMAECSPTGLQPGTTFIKGLVMRYEILGVRRAWLVPFDESALAVPTIGRCEQPIVDAPQSGP